MFQNVAIAAIHIDRASPPATKEDEVVTDPVPVATSSAQTDGRRTENSTQTDVTLRHAAPNPRHDEAEETAVTSLLLTVGPMMLRELTKTGKQSALFAELDRFQEATSEKDAMRLFTLAFDYDAYFQAGKPSNETSTAAAAVTAAAASPTKQRSAESRSVSGLRLACTGVSWNATGAMIAASYGRLDHTGWCNYRSALCFWQIFDSDFNPNKPALVLETSSGLMCVRFHPTKPHIVAAGSFNGEVLLWDLDADEFGFHASEIGDYFHREPVNQVSWVWNAEHAEFEIASVSGDGKVLFWRLRDKLAHPRQGYALLPRNITATTSSGSESPTATSMRGGVDHPSVYGGKAIAFSPKDKTSTFVVGSEGGAVVRCFAARKAAVRSDGRTEKVKWDDDALQALNGVPISQVGSIKTAVEKYAMNHKLKNIAIQTLYDANVDPYLLYPSAMDFSYAMHNGPVYGISFSPFRKSIFATCSSDGSVRVYSYYVQEPLIAIDVTAAAAYLYAIEWSRVRPMVFATAAEDGNVYVYDLKVDPDTPVLILNNGSNNSSSSTTSASPVKGAKGSTIATTTTTAASNAMFALDFNPRQRNFLAAGDSLGKVHIWKSAYLANLQSGEQSMLDALDKD